MKWKPIAIAVTALGAVYLETVNLYKQIMGRNDRASVSKRKKRKRANDEAQRQIEAAQQPYIEWAQAQSPEKCTITSDRGDILRGCLWRSPCNSKVVVIGSHGFHTDHEEYPHSLIKHYLDCGYGFFGCDHVGCSSSGGKYIGFDYYESKDLLKWIDFLTAKIGNDILVILHGMSMGAAAVLQLAGDNCPDCVKLIISDSAYTCAEDQFKYVAGRKGFNHIEPVMWLFNEINKRYAGFDLKLTDVRHSVKHAKVPVLFIHGGNDSFVPAKMVYELYNICPVDKKQIKVFDTSVHAGSVYTNESEYLHTVDNFIAKRLKQ